VCARPGLKGRPGGSVQLRAGPAHQVSRVRLPHPQCQQGSGSIRLWLDQ
ncbi:hypothetical protein HaLaN_25906, partial [Haematococcus lacustris]